MKEIIDAIDESPALCNHVHLPVQSGSSRVLDRMKRLYTREEYMRRIEWMKRSHRDIAISTDIIVGFPGETEEDFQATLDLLEQVEYDSVFSFKYSKRPNTPRCSTRIRFPKKRNRGGWRSCRRSSERSRFAAMPDMSAKSNEVIVEGFNKATGQWIGRTSQNKTSTSIMRTG